MHPEDLEPPSYEDCTVAGPPLLTIDLKDTRVYTPATNHNRTRSHYRVTSSLNREFVKGGFGVFRVNPWKPTERIEIFDVRAISDARFRIAGLGCDRRVASCERKFGFSGHWWEVKQTDERTLEESRVFTAKKAGKEDGTLRWCDSTGSLIARDTKLVRRRGNHENSFQMPVLTIVAEIEPEVLDILVASWLARVWVEVVNAKKKTLMDGGAYL